MFFVIRRFQAAQYRFEFVIGFPESDLRPRAIFPHAYQGVQCLNNLWLNSLA